MMKSAISIILLAGAVRAAPAADTYNTIQPYAVPNLLNSIPRTLEIADKRKGWLYNFTYPFGVAAYPYGTLADKKIAEQQKIWQPPVYALGGVIVGETQLALEHVIAVSWDSSLGSGFAICQEGLLPLFSLFNLSYPKIKYTLFRFMPNESLATGYVQNRSAFACTVADSHNMSSPRLSSHL
jgi:hypothetical protein